MVVSNTSPLNYLILINQIDLLRQLYGRVLVPASVLEELRAAGAPEVVRTWAAHLPEWVEVSAATSDDTALSRLHVGERDAISLGLEVNAGAILIDERHGRQEAESRGLKVIGTVGALAAAHERGLVDLIDAIDSLRQTTFHVSPKLLASIVLRYSK